MRDYGIVSPRFWIGETGKALRGDMPAQVLAMYLMTSPHSTMTGVFHCPVLYMAHETGMEMEGASKALQRLIEGGFCEYEEASETVFVVRMAAYQIGESLSAGDNRVKGLRKEVSKMPEGRIKSRFLEVYGEAYHLAEETNKASPSKAPSEPLRSQEQEQDQEQEQKQDQDNSADAGRQRKQADYPDEFEDAWKAYPARAGGNPKRKALQAWSARRKAGVSAETMLQGVHRYARYCALTGKLNTEFVKQGATFFGPDEHYLNDWSPPAQPAGPGPGARKETPHERGQRMARERGIIQ